MGLLKQQSVLLCYDYTQSYILKKMSYYQLVNAIQFTFILKVPIHTKSQAKVLYREDKFKYSDTSLLLI